MVEAHSVDFAEPFLCEEEVSTTRRRKHPWKKTLPADQSHSQQRLTPLPKHRVLQRVFRSPRTPNINPHSKYKLALLCVLYILVGNQFISVRANTVPKTGDGESQSDPAYSAAPQAQTATGPKRLWKKKTTSLREDQAADSSHK